MATVNVAKCKWNKPPTSVYENNYGYGINYYRPMIDYLDAKEKGITPASLPHVPWTNERGLSKYRADLPVHAYSEKELNRLSQAVAEQAKKNLQKFHGAKHSASSVRATIDAANVLKYLQKESVTVKVKRKKAERNRKEAEEQKIMAALLLESDKENEVSVSSALESAAKILRGKSAKAIEATLLSETRKNASDMTGIDIHSFQRNQNIVAHDTRAHLKMMDERTKQNIDDNFLQPLDELRDDLKTFHYKNSSYFLDKSKQTSIEIEQLNARVVEAETKLKTEVTRIKKKLQIQITELELSLDVANKTNIDLQKTIKKQSLQLTEIQAHYDEVQRQLQVTLDQYGVAQRRIQSLTGEVEEIRGNYEQALRAKRSVEQQYEEATTRINELTVINVNLSSSKAKIEQELATIAADYDEITKELRISDERYQRVQVELKHTVEHLHEEQERIVKIEAIKKSLEIEVKNVSIRLEEVEANAIVGGKRIISKLEARIRDIELELDEEKRRHAETIKILRKKERTVKEVMIQCEEDQKNIALLQDSLEKQSQKVSIYKRQLQEQEGMSQQSVTRVRRFQRELEAAEDRADTAESNLSLIRAKHRTFVTTSSVPGSQVYLVQESRALSTE